MVICGMLLECDRVFAHGTVFISGGKKNGLGLQASSMYRITVGSPASLHRCSKDFHSQDSSLNRRIDVLGFYLEPPNRRSWGMYLCHPQLTLFSWGWTGVEDGAGF